MAALPAEPPDFPQGGRHAGAADHEALAGGPIRLHDTVLGETGKALFRQRLLAGLRPEVFGDPLAGVVPLKEVRSVKAWTILAPRFDAVFKDGTIDLPGVRLTGKDCFELIALLENQVIVERNQPLPTVQPPSELPADQGDDAPAPVQVDPADDKVDQVHQVGDSNPADATPSPAPVQVPPVVDQDVTSQPDVQQPVVTPPAPVQGDVPSVPLTIPEATTVTTDTTTPPAPVVDQTDLGPIVQAIQARVRAEVDAALAAERERMRAEIRGEVVDELTGGLRRLVM